MGGDLLILAEIRAFFLDGANYLIVVFCVQIAPSRCVCFVMAAGVASRRSRRCYIIVNK